MKIPNVKVRIFFCGWNWDSNDKFLLWYHPYNLQHSTYLIQRLKKDFDTYIQILGSIKSPTQKYPAKWIFWSRTMCQRQNLALVIRVWTSWSPYDLWYVFSQEIYLNTATSVSISWFGAKNWNGTEWLNWYTLWVLDKNALHTVFWLLWCPHTLS